MPFLPLDAWPQRGFGDDKLCTHTFRLGYEAFPFHWQEVAVEVAREHSVEFAVFKRQRSLWVPEARVASEMKKRT